MAGATARKGPLGAHPGWRHQRHRRIPRPPAPCRHSAVAKPRRIPSRGRDRPAAVPSFPSRLRHDAGTASTKRLPCGICLPGGRRNRCHGRRLRTGNWGPRCERHACDPGEWRGRWPQSPCRPCRRGIPLRQGIPLKRGITLGQGLPHEPRRCASSTSKKNVTFLRRSIFRQGPTPRQRPWWPPKQNISKPIGKAFFLLTPPSLSGILPSRVFVPSSNSPVRRPVRGHIRAPDGGSTSGGRNPRFPRSPGNVHAIPTSSDPFRPCPPSTLPERPAPPPVGHHGTKILPCLSPPDLLPSLPCPTSSISTATRNTASSTAP
jgi:hypothetical protein